MAVNMKKILALFLVLVSLSELNADITWTSPPDTLSSTGVDSSNPVISQDSSGNTIAVWLEDGVVKSATKPFGMSWGSADTLSGMSASDPCLVIDPSGNATAVWVEGGVIQSAERPFNAGWGSASPISSSTASSPNLAVDATDGSVVAVWVRSGDIEASFKPFGGSFQLTPTVISQTSGGDTPKVAYNNGKAAAVWHNFVSAVDVIFSAKTSLLAWGLEEQISTVGVNSINANVTINSINGNAQAIWFRFMGTSPSFSNVIVQTAAETGTWSTPVDLSLPGIRNPANLMAQVLFDGNGNGLALWVTSFNDDNFFLQFSTQDADGLWSLADDLTQQDTYGFSFDCASSSLGDTVAVYMTGSSTIDIFSTEIDMSSFNRTDPWTVPILLSNASPNGFPSVAAISVSGTIYTSAAWIYNDGMNNLIQAVTGIEVKLEPPTNLQVMTGTNDYGVFLETFYNLSWDASPSGGVTGYAIFRDGRFLTSVTPDVLFFIDNNRDPEATGTYGVAAFDSQFEQSSIATHAYP